MNMTHMNVPIGTDDYVEEVSDKKLVELNQLVDDIAKIPYKHEAFSILKACASDCRIVHLLRTLPPKQSLPFATKFDKILRAGFTTLLECPLPDRAWEQTKFPPKLGGMGLRTGTSTAAAHYAVCVAKCADRINAITGDFDGPAVIERDAAAQLEELFGHITSDQLAETLGTVHEGGKKITLQQQSERILWQRWMKTLTEDDRLNVKTHQGPHHHWVSVPPLEWAGHAMKPRIWVTAVRRRLHLPVAPFAGDCLCCTGGRTDIWGTHQVMCAGGSGTQFKHNGVVKLIAEQARNAGYRVKIEPGPTVDEKFIYVGAGPGDKRHPDLLIYNWEGGKHLMIDVAVHNPLCAAYSGVLAEGGHGAVATMKEDVKDTKYADLDPFRFDFMAFTLETTGAFGDTAAQLCAKLRKRQLERSCRAIDERSSRDPLITAISAEVQRQSAEMILAREPRARNLVVGSQLHLKTTDGDARNDPDNPGASPNPPGEDTTDNPGDTPPGARGRPHGQPR